MKARQKHADALVKTTPREPEEFQDWHRKTLEVFSLCRLKRILDMGCGDGNFSMLLKKACNAKELYGIEISEKGVRSARKKGVRAFRLDIDEDNFPFRDKCFDAIYAGEVIEHLFDTDHFLEDCHRVLKPEGIFVLTTRNLSSLYNRICLLLGYQPFPTSVSLRYNVGRPFELSTDVLGDHIRVFTYRALRELLELHRFEIVRIEGASSVLPNRKDSFSYLVRFLDWIFSRFPSLSQGLILVCKRR